MRSTVQVSVVIPTRNRQRQLARALRSVLGQEGVDLEVIVVDDASDGPARAYIDGLDDPRIRVVHHGTRQGVAAARNTGIHHANAPWIAFTDDDDLWSPQKLHRQLDRLERTPGAAWCGVGAVFIDGDFRVVESMGWPGDAVVTELLLEQNVVPGGGSGVVVARALISELGGFDPELDKMADWDMWLRLAERCPPVGIDDPLVAYLRHTDSLSGQMIGGVRELQRFNAKHSARRMEVGASTSPAEPLRWMAQMHARAGRRAAAGRRYRDLVRAGHGQRFHLLRALVLLAPATLIAVRDRRAGRRVPVSWRLEAEAWLAPYRDAAA